MANIGYEGMTEILANSFSDDNINADALAKWRDDIDSEIKAITDDRLTLMKFIRETEAEIRRLESLKNQVESAKASLAASIDKQDMLCARRNLIENMMVVMSYMEED